MKKFTLLFMAAMLMGFFANAQVIFSDDFESYGEGDFVADNSTTWTTWSDAPGTAEDAVISTNFASSGTNSMLIASGNDVVLPLGDVTTGAFYIAFNVYLETGDNKAGYYNLQHVFGADWAFDVFFMPDSTGQLQAGDAVVPFDFMLDEWHTIEHFVDLDNDLITLKIDGSVIYRWPYSWGSTGTTALGVANFYAYDNSGAWTPSMYFDDVTYETLQPVEFNVDMSAAIGDGSFDPATDTVILAGSVNGWAGPGTDSTMFMTDEDEDQIYTITKMLLPGDYEYKYFKNSGWNGGEWEGGDNRSFTLAEEPLVLNDIWGDPTNFIAPVEEIQFSVYPNPTSGIVNITTDRDAEVTVSNTAGQIVMHKVLGENGTINLTNETTGVYFVTVKTNEGTATQRIIVE